jgi:hypothetical protein
VYSVIVDLANGRVKKVPVTGDNEVAADIGAGTISIE